MHLVWHRADLRLHDHPALTAALQQGPVLGVVVLDPLILGATSPRRRAWFYANTQALRTAYAQRGGVLLVRTGSPWEVLPRLANELGAQGIFAVRNSTPYARFRDGQLEKALPGRIRWFGGQYVQEPGTVLKPDGAPYTVFTPYSKRWWQAEQGRVLPAPEHFPALSLPAEIAQGEIPLEEAGVPLPPAGEDSALRVLEGFLRDRLAAYPRARDLLDGSGVSRLSPYFTLGVLSPRLAVHQALQLGGEGAQKWVNELIWRDFSGDLLYHHPRMLEAALDPRWEGLPQTDDPELYGAWLQGQTGIPVVDAGMRELQATGFVSNRARMVLAQFAVKLALIYWRPAERAFRDLLLDGDNASNLQGWQWAGGLGVDAAPYFRVFNLTHQALTHDPGGVWLRKWVPESGGNPEPYKPPVLDLEAARRRYLEAAQRIAKGAR
ncbi:cryptochrome/photolyase family protein [Meiothermus granaticius]|uniref:Deoxyribodipyrimidine photo-lyase n=1 Tax=Meiothermus granaticius NBRC 107808 TaxID=1227551 RepID=A0A399FB45_9DEIN|nr:deoxyribodipyrimidine photo-lyase [Meiothermus granaticius]RIH92925.1 Deoxyribodipyrimidine photo-lyase [Meiothermus granaticius NBRC 107808]GEM86781.1 deoxyribodipyrimidine photo-lyase [Meiothermus granaticius NBRC 107808]